MFVFLFVICLLLIGLFFGVAAGPCLDESVQTGVEAVAQLVGGLALGYDFAGADLHVVAVLDGEGLVELGEQCLNLLGPSCRFVAGR